MHALSNTLPYPLFFLYFFCEEYYLFQILSLHSHEQGHHENENEHNHEHEENEKSHNEKSYIGHMTALLASLYFLFIFEMFSTVAANYCKVRVVTRFI